MMTDEHVPVSQDRDHSDGMATERFLILLYRIYYIQTCALIF